MGVDMKSSIHQRNRDNEIYVLGRGEIQGITTVGPTITKGNTTPGTTIYAEKVCNHNFTEQN